MINYFLGIVIALDQLINALIGGDPDEMISARAHREALKGSTAWILAEIFIDVLFFWQEAHCTAAKRYEDKVILEKAKKINETKN